MRLKTIELAVLILALLVPARSAHAYVDPGILSVLFQGLYVAVFGAATAFIFRPWNYLKSVFGKRKPGPQAAPEQELDNPN